MIIDCVADLHGNRPPLDGGDLLIVAGDLTRQDTIPELKQFFDWFGKLEYDRKILIGGNHDNFLSNCLSTEVSQKLGLGDDEGYEYLCDSGTVVQYWSSGHRGVGILNDLKIWGTPWTPAFAGINPKCMAFTMPFGCDTEDHLKEHWDLIPDDTDILITHGPPFGMLDENIHGEYCGSKSLNDRILKLKLKYHIFGHIHESYGECYQYYSTKDAFDENPVPGGHLSINCSHVDVHYRPRNKPVRIVL